MILNRNSQIVATEPPKPVQYAISALQRDKKAVFTETGMPGGADPFNRGFFTERDRELTEFYRRLGNMRKNSPALRRGTLEITEKPGAVVISRSLGGETRTLTVSPTEFDIR